MEPPTILLAVGAAGALGTANALRPLAEDGPASFASFGAGAITSEIPLVHAGAHGLVAAALVARGGLATWRGRLGLGLTVAACAGALRVHREATGAGRALEQALVEAFGTASGTRSSTRPDRTAGRTR